MSTGDPLTVRQHPGHRLPPTATAEQAQRSRQGGAGKGLLLLIIGIPILAAVLYVAFFTLRFYRQIQLGEIPSEIKNRVTYSTIKAPQETKASLAYAVREDPTFGPADAPLQIVEFADFQCPYSRDESLIIRELQTRYPEKMHFVYRDFPLSDIHPRAEAASEAGQCAEVQGKFWPMHDKLFQNFGRLTDIDLKQYALEIGLDIVKFNSCLDNGTYKDEVAADRADGIAAGVEGTPTFFINGQKIAGAIPQELWDQILQKVR